MPSELRGLLEKHNIIMDLAPSFLYDVKFSHRSGMTSFPVRAGRAHGGEKLTSHTKDIIM